MSMKKMVNISKDELSELDYAANAVKYLHKVAKNVSTKMFFDIMFGAMTIIGKSKHITPNDIKDMYDEFLISRNIDPSNN